MNDARNPYSGYRYAEIVSHNVWLYFRAARPGAATMASGWSLSQYRQLALLPLASNDSGWLCPDTL